MTAKPPEHRSVSDGASLAPAALARDVGLSAFRSAVRVRRLRGMHRLAEALYNPYRREDDYFEGVCEYGDGLIQVDTRSFIEWWIYMYGAFEGGAVSLLSRLVQPSSTVSRRRRQHRVVLPRPGQACRQRARVRASPASPPPAVENLALNNLRNVIVSDTA